MSVTPSELDKINAEMAELEQKKLELERVKHKTNPTEQESADNPYPPGEPTDEEISARIKTLVPIIGLFLPIGIIMIWRLPKFKGHLISKIIITLLAPFISAVTWAIIYFTAIIPILHLVGLR